MHASSRTSRTSAKHVFAGPAIRRVLIGVAFTITIIAINLYIDVRSESTVTAGSGQSASVSSSTPLATASAVPASNRPTDFSAFVFASFSDGRSLGEGMRILYSADARDWQNVAGDALVIRQGAAGGTVFRDPSICWFNGWFHLVFTTELCAGLQHLGFDCHWERRTPDAPPPRFGYARSRDLLNWVDLRPISVPLRQACNVWAPELYILSDEEADAVQAAGWLDTDETHTGKSAPSHSATNLKPDAAATSAHFHAQTAAGPTNDAADETPGRNLRAKSKQSGSPSSFQNARANSRANSRSSSRAKVAVVFSSTVAAECPPNFGPGARGTKHLPYAMFTSDFETFSAPKLLFDPGESAIDAQLFRKTEADGRQATYMVYKSEQNECREWLWRADGGHGISASESCTLVLRLARARNLASSFSSAPLGRTPFWTDSISRQCVEGPSVVKLADEFLLLFDSYRTDCPLRLTKPQQQKHIELQQAQRGRGAHQAQQQQQQQQQQQSPCVQFPGLLAEAVSDACIYRGMGGFGALVSRDLRDWDDISDTVSLPAAHKHGTAIRLCRDALCSICHAAANASDLSFTRSYASTGLYEHCPSQCGVPLDALPDGNAYPSGRLRGSLGQEQRFGLSREFVSRRRPKQVELGDLPHILD